MDPLKQHRRLSPHDERQIAVRACVDPRTVRAYLAGKHQRSTTRAAIEQALREMNEPPAAGRFEEGSERKGLYCKTQ